VLTPVSPLRIEASARVDGWRSFDGSRIDGAAQPPTSTTYENKRNGAFAPRLGVRYQLARTFALRSSFYQAFRAPTLSEEYRTFYAGPNTFMGNPALTPEYLTGFDGGFDWRPADAVEVRATAFYNRYRDLDNFEFAGPNPATGGIFLQRQNLGQARSRGVEGEVAFRLLSELTLAATYNYDDARVIDHDTTAQYINRVPLQRVSARATYSSPRIATLNAVVRYEGRNHTLQGTPLAPFTVFDIDARRELYRGMDLFLSVENLFDRQYPVNYAGPLEYIGLPRTVRAGLLVSSF
jgi:iron complex outermembrane receptor protein